MLEQTGTQLSAVFVPLANADGTFSQEVVGTCDPVWEPSAVLLVFESEEQRGPRHVRTALLSSPDARLFLLAGEGRVGRIEIFIFLQIVIADLRTKEVDAVGNS